MLANTAMMTPDDLVDLDRPGAEHYELSDGKLIIVGTAGALHELIKTAVYEILTEYRLRTGSGRVFCESMFTLGSERARVPDVSWVSNGRFAQIPREDRAIPIAPDIAVEIISDSERIDRAQQKLRDYLDAGVEVWQIFPGALSVTIWSGTQGTRLNGDQSITSEKLPGFSVAVSDLFSA